MHGDKIRLESGKVFVQEVIICTKETRGDGRQEAFRKITQVFTLDGELIAEDDPLSCEFCGAINCQSDHK
jgi:hypothetical protein